MKISIKTHSIILTAASILIAGCSANQKSSDNKNESIRFLEVNQIKVKDPFWSPKLELWSTVTANDVLNKFEGQHVHDAEVPEDHDAIHNFDRVARGERGIGKHAGFPWFDGLVYETIRGIADFLAQSPDIGLEQRIYGYVDRIYAAQQSDSTGYIETYTQLVEPDHQWGEHGGFLRWQHDVYNAGMLVEAGVHYYKATGKTKLLEVATRFTNYMCAYMGPEPKKNVVPSHSGPEEAMMKLYWLYKDNPDLKKKMNIPVNENDYYELVKYWVENRGNHCGYPLWLTWGNGESEKWIKDEKYNDPQFGPHSRPSWGDYAQDSISVFKQKTIEGHAVRATLLATGIATMAVENHAAPYIETASNLWDNMAGKRMFITGGVGAVHFDEKFGPDYFLPTDAYLETCAAVGAGFFSQRMNQLTGDGKYMDELERILYNSVLTGISLSGDHYTYQNPLNSDKYSRWEWHECPCCPPMFLKMVSALPGYIYSHQKDTLYVNLFIGSEAQIKVSNKTTVQLKQETRYPWDGAVSLAVDPEKESQFSVKIRIPGWAQGHENPYGLYASNLSSPAIVLKVNGNPVETQMNNGYAVIDRMWKKGDKVEFSLPMQPRIIHANDQVSNLKDLVAIASGPVIYCLEDYDNKDLQQLRLDTDSPMEITYKEKELNGVNVITAKAVGQQSKEVAVTAIPYYTLGNRQEGCSYKVWIPKQFFSGCTFP